LLNLKPNKYIILEKVINKTTNLKGIAVKKLGEDAVNFISKYADFDSQYTHVVSTTNFINAINTQEVDTIVNLSKINNIRFINKFFEAVNKKFDHGDTYIGCVETINGRKNRKRTNKIPIIRDIYFALEFIFLRVFPKISFFKRAYFVITRGRNRLLSKSEALGRLVSCGFKIVDFESHNGLLFFVVKKERTPYFDMNPSYGLLYRMPRVGKNGKTIFVYKFRTMHPYAEYLQSYIIEKNGYAETGKPADDFRLTPWGKLFRKFWIDELPQLINVLIGDMKLVGVRPVSKYYFSQIPKDLQDLRLKQKPGCIPPYVSLNRVSTVESVLEAEKDYLLEKLNNPYTTDTKYFFKAIYNIVFKNKRSA
jgi:lipopolysaccharide/colanic/teichoic acid biosynthesis glycosyltransferase